MSNEQTKQPADAVYDKDGKRLRWQCGCRQNGGVQVQAYKPPKTSDELREAFESWIMSSPFEMSIDRFPDNVERYAWPGHYVCIDVQLAWAAWQAATEAST